MAIQNNKTRIIFTLPKQQADWLEKTSKKLKISKSKLIRWLIEKNVKNLQQWTNPDEFEALVKIVKTPWINNPWED